MNDKMKAAVLTGGMAVYCAAVCGVFAAGGLTADAAETIQPIDAAESYRIEAALELACTVDSAPQRRYLGQYTVTYYCPCVLCCGKSTDDPRYGHTATGAVATEGRTIAVDPDVIPYGSTVVVEYGDAEYTYIAEDCGGGIDGAKVDIFVADHDRALALGVQTASVYIEETVV